MAHTLPEVDGLRPPGSKRSNKRELILNVFLRQEGHLSADDLVELIRREDQRISRATVYRWLGRQRPPVRLQQTGRLRQTPSRQCRRASDDV